eukprot:m.233801 g.233801  ORF g.233801 m.233801 type:complete len:654 (+) comp10883_c0_seq1:1510-3471(+)
MALWNRSQSQEAAPGRPSTADSSAPGATVSMSSASPDQASTPCSDPSFASRSGCDGARLIWALLTQRLGDDPRVASLKEALGLLSWPLPSKSSFVGVFVAIDPQLEALAHDIFETLRAKVAGNDQGAGSDDAGLGFYASATGQRHKRTTWRMATDREIPSIENDNPVLAMALDSIADSISKDDCELAKAILSEDSRGLAVCTREEIRECLSPHMHVASATIVANSLCEMFAEDEAFDRADLLQAAIDTQDAVKIFLERHASLCAQAGIPVAAEAPSLDPLAAVINDCKSTTTTTRRGIICTLRSLLVRLEAVWASTRAALVREHRDVHHISSVDITLQAAKAPLANLESGTAHSATVPTHPSPTRLTNTRMSMDDRRMETFLMQFQAVQTQLQQQRLDFEALSARFEDSERERYHVGARLDILSNLFLATSIELADTQQEIAQISDDLTGTYDRLLEERMESFEQSQTIEQISDDLTKARMESFEQSEKIQRIAGDLARAEEQLIASRMEIDKLSSTLEYHEWRNLLADAIQQFRIKLDSRLKAADARHFANPGLHFGTLLRLKQRKHLSRRNKAAARNALRNMKNAYRKVLEKHFPRLSLEAFCALMLVKAERNAEAHKCEKLTKAEQSNLSKVPPQQASNAEAIKVLISYL